MTEYNQEPKEVIEEREETKKFLLDHTNIENSPEEMNVLDNIIFRLWQCGITIKEFKQLTKYKRAFEILNLNFTLICKEDDYLCNKKYYLLSDTYTEIEKEEAELLEELMKDDE